MALGRAASGSWIALPIALPRLPGMYNLAELGVYGVMLGGLASLVAASDYLEYPVGTGSHAQPRYLLPAAALFGAVLALSARAGGRRWGPLVGVAIIVLFIAHDIFSQCWRYLASTVNALSAEMFLGAPPIAYRSSTCGTSSCAGNIRSIASVFLSQ